MDPITIRRVDVEQIIDLRWRVLRAGLDRTTACFDGDEEPTTHHLAAMRQERLVGCVTILQRPFEERPAWQLRGMAVEPSIQKQGIGRALLDRVEQVVRQSEHSHQLWCNARVPAASFYQRIGWRIVSEPFEIPTAGPHVRMSRLLD